MSDEQSRVRGIQVVALCQDQFSSIITRTEVRPNKSGQLDGAVAQLGERMNGIHEVRGSIPLGSTKIRFPPYCEPRPSRQTQDRHRVSAPEMSIVEGLVLR